MGIRKAERSEPSSCCGVPYSSCYCSGEWKFPDNGFQRFAACDVVHFAASAGNLKAKEALGKLPEPPGRDLWALCPAAKQLLNLYRGLWEYAFNL